jgi:hypothetical protein
MVVWESAWIGVNKTLHLSIFRNSIEKGQASLTSNKNNWTLHFVSYLTQFFLEWKRFRQSCRETRNTHFIFNIFFFENRAVYEIKWKNVVAWGRPQITIWRMRIAWWIRKVTNTHTGCVILTWFPLKQYSQERASLLRYTYIVFF